MEKLKARTVLSWIILVVMLLLIYILMKDRLVVLKNLFEVPLYYVLLIAFFTFMYLLMLGIIFRTLMDFYNLRLKTKEWLGLTFVMKFANYLSPVSLGMTTKAIYLKKKYGFSINKVVVVTGATFLLDFFIYALAGLISLVLLYFIEGFSNQLLTLIVSVIFFFTTIIMFLPIRFKEVPNKLINYVIKIINGWNQLTNNKKLLFKLILLHVFLVVLSTLRFKLLFMAYSIPIGILACTLIYSLNRASMVLKITPGNIGISEGIIVFTGHLLGIGFNDSLMVALLDRAISFVIIFIFGPIYTYLLIKK